MAFDASGGFSPIVIDRAETTRPFALSRRTRADAVNKNIFLTGASSGIGLATAKALVTLGHEVWGTSRDVRRLPDLQRLHPVLLDLADARSVAEGFETALAQAGNFDVVINNAGSGHFGASDTLSMELVQEQFQTLVFAQIELCRLALAAMRDHGSGLIVNVTSLASRLPVPYMGAYNAAKAAMASFTMTLQLELEQTEIYVVDVQPADIRTGFNDAVRKTGNVDSIHRTRLERTWKIVNENMQRAPGPELVARRIAQLIETDNPPPRITVGDTFQSQFAPVIFRLLPQRVRIWGLKRYYKL